MFKIDRLRNSFLIFSSLRNFPSSSSWEFPIPTTNHQTIYSHAITISIHHIIRPQCNNNVRNSTLVISCTIIISKTQQEKFSKVGVGHYYLCTRHLLSIVFTNLRIGRRLHCIAMSCHPSVIYWPPLLH